jgi:hypothetical protein
MQLVYVDGSAHSLRPRDIWTKPWNKEFDISYVARQGPTFFPEWMR